MLFEWQETTHYWALNNYAGNGYLLFLDGPPYRWAKWASNALNYHTLHATTIDEAKRCLEVIARMNA